MNKHIDKVVLLFFVPQIRVKFRVVVILELFVCFSISATPNIYKGLHCRPFFLIALILCAYLESSLQLLVCLYDVVS